MSLLHKSAILLAAAGLLYGDFARAHTCPPDATATAVGVTVTAFRENGSPVGQSRVAACETLSLVMSVVYIPTDPITLGRAAAFEDGRMVINAGTAGFVADVTPTNGIPMLGGDGTPGCDGVDFVVSRRVAYTVTAADVAAGQVRINGIYTNGTAHIGEGELVDVVSGTQGFIVQVIPPVVCNIQPAQQAICASGSASFTVTATNGTAPYDFVWSGPNGFTATQLDVTNATITITNVQAANAGLYRVTVTDTNGCTNICQALLIVNPNPVCSINPPQPELCFGPSNCVNLTVTPSGATAPYTVVWTGPSGPLSTNVTSTNVTFQVCATTLGTNVYTATITDANGCIGSCVVPVVVNPNPICSIEPPSAQLCLGPLNCADYVVTPAAGEAPYVIVWSGPGGPIATNTTTTNATFRVCATQLGTRVFTATIRDANGCVGSCTATNIVTPNPVCTIEPPIAELCFGPVDCVNYLVTPSGGAAPYRIVWSGPGGPIQTNITSSNAVFTVCGTLLGTNTYTASITDSNGCFGSCTAINIVNPNPICRISPPTAELCFGVSNCIDYVVTPSNGEAPYTVVWSGPGGAILTNITPTTATFRVCATLLGTNIYTASITDNNGCVSSCTATNIVNPNPTCLVEVPTNEICVGFSASFTAVPSSGTPPYRFDWNGPAGFTSTNQTITVSNALLINAGIYSVLVTDAEGCTTTCQGRLIVNPNPVCTIAPPTNEVCVGFSATFTAIPSSGTAPYRFNWNGPNGFASTNQAITIADAQLTNAGIYSVLVTDAEGCTTTCQGRLIVNPNPICTITPATNEVCVGFAATFTVNPSSGTAPYQFSWTGPNGFTSTNATITIASAQLANAGVYVATVTDAEGCITTCNARLIVNQNPVCTITPATNELCVGFPATFTVNPSSGTAPYTYAWTGPAGFTSTNQSITIPSVQVTNAGLYTVTVTDAEGCTTTCQGRLIVNPNPICAITASRTTICAEECVDIRITPSSGEPLYRVVLNGPGGPISTNVTAGAVVLQTVCPPNLGSNVYTATITDTNGCVTTCSITVTVNPNPICLITPATNEVCVSFPATFSVVASSGTPPYQFNWTGPNGFASTNQTITITNAQLTNAGIYTNIVVDAAGCTTSCEARLIVNPNPLCVVAPLTNELCVGFSAAFTVTPSSGTAPYRFLWSGPNGFSSTNQTINITNAQIVQAGLYTALVTDAEGCTTTCQGRLIVNPNPICVITPATNEICAGFAATFTVGVSSGTEPYRFNWTGPNGFTSTNQTILLPIAQLADAGLYTVTVTDAEGCTTTCQGRLIVNPNPLCLVTPATNEICAGFSAMFTVSPSSGTPPYRFNWTGPNGFNSTNQTFTITNGQLAQAGLYTAVVTDSEGCTTTCQGRLIVNPNPICIITPATNEVCAGFAATFAINPSSGTPPYRYSWAGPSGFTSTNQTITITNAQLVNAGVYTATVTDAEGCVTSCEGRLIVNPNPVCTITPSTNEICAGSSATFTVNAFSGTAPYRINWNGPNGFTSTNATITITNGQLANAGVYVATVTDAEGCTTTCNARLLVNPNPICVVIPSTNEICVGQSATFIVNAFSGTAPYRFNWAGPNGFTSTNATISITNADLGDAGIYSVVVTDAQGCTTTCSGRLIVNLNPVCAITPPTNEICVGFAATFTVNAFSGTPPYSITWMGPAGFTSTNQTIVITNAQLANAGLYTALITDADGCVISCEARLIVNPNPICTITPATNEICAGFLAAFNANVFSGTPPYRFNWTGPNGFTSTNQNITINNAQLVNAGVYTLAVTDAEGCITSCQGRLIVNPNPICLITPATNEICAGASATFAITPSSGAGPYVFSWTGPAGFASTNQTIVITNAQLAQAGLYIATVTDAEGCTTTCQARLIVNPNPICVITPATNEVCAGSLATFTVNPSSGTAPYRYAWTGPNGFSSTNQAITITNAQLLNAGVYIVTVTDVEGCTTTCNARLIVNPNPICTVTPATNEICAGGSATFTVNASSGTAPYTYSWSGPAGFTSTNQSITINNAQLASAGVYTATVTDAEGCTTTCQARLIVNPNPICVITPATNEVCVGFAATFTVNSSSGTAPYRYAWTGPAGFASTNQTITITNAQLANAGVYTVAVTDAEGCMTTCNARLIVNPNPICSITPATNEVCAGFSATFTVNPSSGTAPYRFAWTGPGGFTSTNQTIALTNVQLAQAGLYAVVVTDAEGCTTTCQGRLIVNPNPICTVAPATNELCVGSTATFTVNPSSGTAPYRFAWTGPGGFISTNQTISIPNAQLANAGFYTVIVTDAEGCTNTCQGRLIVNPNPVCSIVASRTSICPEECVDIRVTPTGGEAPYTVVLSGPNGPIATNVTSSTTIVTVCPPNLGSNVYTAAIVDSNGCAGRCDTQVIVNPNPVCSVTPPSVQQCVGTNCVNLVVTPSGGRPPYSVVWTEPGGLVISQLTTNFVVIQACATTVGTFVYDIGIIDANGCETSCFATNTVTPAPVCAINPVETQLCARASVTLTASASQGAAPYTFTWSGPNNFTASGPSITLNNVQMVNAGLYTAVVVDRNGCSNICSSTIRVNECEAAIDVIKEIVCWTPAGCDAFNGSHHAVGAKVGAQCPSFCYRITVTNTSPGNVELRNLLVTDSQLNLGGCSFPTVLPPRGSATCILSNVTHCDSVTNTVTASATGVDVTTGTVIGERTDSDTTIGEVIPIAVVCDKFVSSPADLDLTDGPYTVTLPSDGVTYPVTYGVAISNASALPLLVFIQDPTLANCPLPGVFTTGVALAPHEVQVWPSICTANLQCGVDPLEGELVNTIFVAATVNTAVTNVCAHTPDGREIFATNTCSATVRCPSPAACRTTGGGRQDADSPHGALAWPLQGGGIECLDGMDVRYVTHGGQVGAPVGNAITFDPDSECIQGNWEHVRHAQGGRRANFHAKSFDSLLCACLGEGSEPGIVIDGVCNPDDKKNGSGPLPRKAPANKITFSGVGDYTCQKGGRAPRACLFRVDLEDRSEPGGFHPGGGRPPADRYRIRIWVLTPQEKAALDGAVNSLNDPGLCSFRRAIAATETNTRLTDGAEDASGNPVALGTPVFGVRRPDVDDGGEMQHGNHQIHPQIKQCTKPVHACPTP